MNVLLTGAYGFIGRALWRQLREAGHEVVAVDARIAQAHTRRVPTSAEFSVVQHADVRDADALAPLLDGVDVVCHQAAMVGAGLAVSDLPGYAAHNDLGTAVLLSAMSARGVDRLVLASSMVVYGDGRYECGRHGLVRPSPRTTDQLASGRFDPVCPSCSRTLEWRPIGEDSWLDPRGSYATSKVAQEHYARSWAMQAPASCIALRYHNVYGPHMPRDTPYAGVAAIWRSALERGEAPRVFEDGRQMRDFVHVNDVARANLLAVEAVRERGQGSFDAYNICSGRPVSISQVARILTSSSLADVSPLITGEFRVSDVRHVVASPSRAAEELGFVASVPPDVGLARFTQEPLRA